MLARGLYFKHGVLRRCCYGGRDRAQIPGCGHFICLGRVPKSRTRLGPDHVLLLHFASHDGGDVGWVLCGMWRVHFAQFETNEI